MGKIIISTLISILPFTQLSHPHEEDPFTTYIQEKLIELGYLEVANGVNDKTSQSAIKLFQEKYGLIVDGMVGEQTFTKLLLGKAAHQTPETTSKQIEETNSPTIDTLAPVWDEEQPPYASEIGSLFNLNMPAVTDNVGIVSYEVFVNGALSTYATISDSTLLVTPKYDMTCADQLIYVIAFDEAGNSSQSPTFTIPQTDPCISTISPDTDAPTFNGGVVISDIGPRSAQVSWNAASDNIGVTSYQVLVDNSVVSTTSTTSYSLTTSNLSSTNTSYNIVIKAFDAAGNSSSISSSFTTLPIQPAKLTGISWSPNPTTDVDSVILTVTFDCDDIEYECPWQVTAYFWSNPTSGESNIEWGRGACSGGTCTVPKTAYSIPIMPISIDYLRAYYTGSIPDSFVLYRYDGTVLNPVTSYSNHNLSFINYLLNSS